MAFVYDPPTGPLSVIHRDESLLVIDKPSGLLSVPGKSDEHKDCLESRVKKEFVDTLLVHRLDMDTSGLIIFALTKAAQRHLGLQFERRHIKKTYQAMVAGNVLQDEGEVTLPLVVDWPNRPLQKVCAETGKPAQTHWKVLEHLKNSTRLHLYPITGRSHQLRVHMKETGHPILGDRFYASGQALSSVDRLMLHSEALSLFHPNGGERVSFHCPCPF